MDREKKNCMGRKREKELKKVGRGNNRRRKEGKKRGDNKQEKEKGELGEFQIHASIKSTRSCTHVSHIGYG